MADEMTPAERNELAIESDLLIYGSAFTVDGRRVDPTTVVVRTYQPPNVVVVSPLTSVRERCICDPERWRHDDVCPLS